MGGREGKERERRVEEEREGGGDGREKGRTWEGMGRRWMPPFQIPEYATGWSIVIAADLLNVEDDG